MLGKVEQESMTLSPYSELFDILIEKDDFWRVLNEMVDSLAILLANLVLNDKDSAILIQVNQYVHEVLLMNEPLTRPLIHVPAGPQM